MKFFNILISQQCSGGERFHKSTLWELAAKLDQNIGPTKLINYSILVYLFTLKIGF